MSSKENMNPYDTNVYDTNVYDTNVYDYEDPQSSVHAKRKKKIAFRDILSNMSLVVNKQGVLQQIQIMPPIQETAELDEYLEESTQQSSYMPPQQSSYMPSQ
ncbi:MAG: hypothetical protein ACOVRN_14790, partial [Flavobacterium sp.]